MNTAGLYDNAAVLRRKQPEPEITPTEAAPEEEPVEDVDEPREGGHHLALVVLLAALGGLLWARM